jgi:putative ABC transport system permease protein
MAGARPLTPLAHAIRNVTRRPARALILVFAVALLVAVLVFALSFVRRVEASIRVASERLGADVLVVPTGSRGAAEDVLLDNAVKTFYMDRSVVERVRALRGVARVTTQTYLATVTGGCCDVPESLVVAFDPETDFVVAPWLQGRRAGKLGRGEAIVGSESAFNIGLGLTHVDGKLFGTTFRIVGTLERTGTGLDTAIFVSEESAAAMLSNGTARVPPGAVSVVFARVEEGVDPARVAGMVEDTIIEADAVARRDVGRSVLRALVDVKRIFLVTFVLASLLAMSLTWAVFSGIANERRREVGLMLALGATPWQVVKLFLLEVVLVGALGSAVGAVSGTGLSLALARGFTVLKNVTVELGAGDRLAVALAGLVAGTAICVLGAISPIRSTGRTEPLAVLKGDGG